MNAWQRWASHLTSAVVVASGLALFWMKYVLETDDPFAVVNHPWQPAALALHVVASPVLLVVFGALLEGHVLRKLRNGPQPSSRRSGIGAWWTFVGMALSGYLLQVTTAESLRTVLLVLHLVSGAVFAGAYTAHVVSSVRRSRQVGADSVRERAA